MFSAPDIHSETNSDKSAMEAIWEEATPQHRIQLLEGIGNYDADLKYTAWINLPKEVRNTLQDQVKFKGKTAAATEMGQALEELARAKYHKSVDQLTWQELNTVRQAIEPQKAVPVYELRAEIEHTDLKQFDRVQRVSTGDKGSVLMVNDSKPGDCDILCLWDNPHEGVSVYEVDLGDIKRIEEPITEQLQEQAEAALKEYQKARKDYEKAFENKFK